MVLIFQSVQSIIHVQLFATQWTAAHQASLSITNSWSLLKLMSIESVVPSNHLILCCPLLLLPSFFASIRIFSNESVLCIRWPKYWGFSISPSNESVQLSSVTQSCLTLWPHGLQHARLPCPSPTLGACSDSCPLSQSWHSNEYSGPISFRIDLFDLLAVQGTLNSLLLCQSSKASILWCSSFFMVQLSHPSVTTGKTTALPRQTFVGKVSSLLFDAI